jgi:hypothetical protein
MRSPTESPAQQTTPLVPLREELALSQHALGKVPFEKWFPLVKTDVDLQPFVDALTRLEQSPLRGEIFNSHAELKEGIQCITAEGERLALERFEGFSESAQKRIIQDLFKGASLNHWRAPISYYTNCIDELGYSIESGRNVWAEAGRSILSEGVLPQRDIQETLKLAQRTLVTNASKLKAHDHKPLMLAGLVTSCFFAPAHITATLGVILGFSSALHYRDVRIAREAVQGYTLELLDTYDTIRSGRIRDLGQTLSEHFGDPAGSEQFQKLWRASGFTVARMLRVFGHSPDEVFELFLNSPGLHLADNPTAERTREHLALHQVPNPATILAPFMDDAERGDSIAPTEELVNSLNEVYFTRAICERERVRYDLSREIFKAAAA